MALVNLGMKIRLIRLMYISQKLTAQRTVKPHRDVRAVRQEPDFDAKHRAANSAKAKLSSRLTTI